MRTWVRFWAFAFAAIAALATGAVAGDNDKPAKPEKAAVGPRLSWVAIESGKVPDEENSAGTYSAIEEFPLGESDAGINIYVGNSKSYLLLDFQEEERKRKNPRTKKEETVTVKVPILRGCSRTSGTTDEGDGRTYTSFFCLGHAAGAKLPNGYATMASGAAMELRANGTALGRFAIVPNKRGGASSFLIYRIRIRDQEPD